ncbi:MAG: hypothetical protein FJX51_10345, partial [Alphaproteobacteria bacterium]|nr:hypothetical protein [Alphaproteobacteria bacterium]
MDDACPPAGRALGHGARYLASCEDSASAFLSHLLRHHAALGRQAGVGQFGGRRVRKYGFGQSVRRSEDPRLLAGQATFCADVSLPRQAHAWIVRSPHAHAELRAVNAEAARAAPGVLAVMTAAEARADGLGDLRPTDPLKNRDGSQPPNLPRPILAE